MNHPHDHKSYLKWRLTNNKPLTKSFDDHIKLDKWIAENWEWLVESNIITDVHQVNRDSTIVYFFIENEFWHIFDKYLTKHDLSWIHCQD